MHYNHKHTKVMYSLVVLCLAWLLLCSMVACESALPENVDASSYTSYLELCAEKGVIPDTSVELFSVDSPVRLDQLHVLLVRLRNVLHGGDGTVPTLPDDPLDYLQFLDADGKLAAGLNDVAEVYAGSDGLCVEFQARPDAQELTLQMAFPGDTMFLCTQGSFVPGSVQTEVDPHSALEILQTIMPEESYVGIVAPEHYSFPVDTEQSVDTYARILSLYQFMVKNNEFDAWDEWFYPYTYYLNFREGHISTEALPQEKENPNRSSSDIACREDLALYLADYCPEIISDVVSSERTWDERYSYSQNLAISRLYQAGILTETDAEGNFDGQQPLTQGEVVAVLARILIALN